LGNLGDCRNEKKRRDQVILKKERKTGLGGKRTSLSGSAKIEVEKKTDLLRVFQRKVEWGDSKNSFR